MADLTSNPPRRAGVRRMSNAEYYVYFSLIFVLALPGATIRWIRDAIRLRTLNLLGPLARAWAEADRMTPLIFSA